MTKEEFEKLKVGDKVRHSFGGIGIVTEKDECGYVVKDKGFDAGDGMDEVSFAWNEGHIVKKSAETQHINKTCKEKVNSLTQVHASEDLDDAAIEICSKVLKGETINIDGYEYVVLSDAEECFKAGAKWQFEQFEMNRLAACDKQTEGEAKIEFDFAMGIIKKEHRQPTFDDAIKYGMRLQEERMMAKAIDAHCFGFQGDALFSFTLPADNYLVGSEVKVIVIEK